jgi:hypothetical protein
VHIETIEPENYPLAEIAQLATDMGVSDLADRHGHYAHPSPKD